MKDLGRTYCNFFDNAYSLYVYHAEAPTKRPLVIIFTHEELLRYRRTFRGAGVRNSPAPKQYALTGYLEVSLDMSNHLMDIIDWMDQEVANKIGRMVRDYLLKEVNEEWGYVQHRDWDKGIAEYYNPITDEREVFPFTVDTMDQKWEYTKEDAMEYIQNKRIISYE